jgi:hypothetical protein
MNLKAEISSGYRAAATSNRVGESVAPSALENRRWGLQEVKDHLASLGVLSVTEQSLLAKVLKFHETLLCGARGSRSCRRRGLRCWRAGALMHRGGDVRRVKTRAAEQRYGCCGIGIHPGIFGDTTGK